MINLWERKELWFNLFFLNIANLERAPIFRAGFTLSVLTTDNQFPLSKDSLSLKIFKSRFLLKVYSNVPMFPVYEWMLESNYIS